MKIRSVEAQLFHTDGRTDGQTDTMKLIVAFGNFAIASKKRQRIQNFETQCCAGEHRMRTHMVLRIILEPNRRELRESCKNYIMRSSINFAICKTLLH
jgi:hypothetical protein